MPRACGRSSTGAISISACSKSLREMKALIEKEVARRDLAEHVKLGPGGIREIEFIAQAFQLIRGGQDRRMQTPVAAGRAAAARRRQAAAGARGAGARGRLSVPAADRESPADAAPMRRRTPSRPSRWRARASPRRWASATGRPAAPSSICIVRGSRARFRKSCSRATTRRPPRRPASTASPKPGCAAPRRSRLRAVLAARGFEDPERAAQLLLDFRGAGAFKRLDAPGRARLDTLVPRLLGAIADNRPRANATGDAARHPAARAQGARGHRFALGVLRAAQ